VLGEEERLALIKQIRDARNAGAIEPDKLEALYMEESASQIIYDPDGPVYSYDNGVIVNADTGTPAPPDVQTDIERRVRLLIPSRSTIGEDAIRKLQRWRADT